MRNRPSKFTRLQDARLRPSLGHRVRLIMVLIFITCQSWLRGSTVFQVWQP